MLKVRARCGGAANSREAPTDPIPLKGPEQVSDPKPFFLQGRRWPDDKFSASVAWHLPSMDFDERQDHERNPKKKCKKKKHRAASAKKHCMKKR